MKRKIGMASVLEPRETNELFEQYKEQWNYFLGNKKVERVYVPDPETEHELELMLDGECHCITYFLGPAGIGKTTILKKFFRTGDNGIFFDEEKKMIYLTQSFQGKLTLHNVEEVFASTLNSFCSVIGKKSALCGSFYTREEQLRFYDYIEKTRVDLLGFVDDMELLGKSEWEIKKLRLTRLREKDAVSYEASKLKFFIQRYFPEYKKIVLIVDNIEVYQSGVQEKILLETLRLQSCLSNTVSDMMGYFVKVLVSMRDHTYGRLMGIPEIASYSPTAIIWKKNPVDIIRLLDLEYQWIKEQKLQKEDMERYQESYEILMCLSTKFNNKYSNMIQNLCNYNISEMKNCYLTILSNGVWMQREQKYKNSRQFEAMINNISVIRSLACKGETYCGRNSKIIPNVFLNDEFGDRTILSLMIILYLYRNQQPYYAVPSALSVSRQRVEMMFKYLYPNDRKISEEAVQVLDILIQYQIIREVESAPDSIGQKEIYLAPKGVEIWNMLASDSVLLEMYKEDHFLDASDTSILWVSSYDCMKTNQSLIFTQAVIYIGILLQKERQYREMSIQCGTLDYYYNCFGRKTISKHLLDGLMKSIEYSGKYGDCSIINEVENLRKKIKQIDVI